MSIFNNFNSYFLQVPTEIDYVAEKSNAESLVLGACIVVMLVSLAAWYVSYRLFRIEKQGIKYYLINVCIAVLYLPFLVWHFFNCYAANFQTGKEHYLLMFFVHSVVMVLWSVGFYGRNKQEESY